MRRVGPTLVGSEDRRGHLRRNTGTSGSREVRKEKEEGRQGKTDLKPQPTTTLDPDSNLNDLGVHSS